jgi:hypothetical protein
MLQSQIKTIHTIINTFLQGYYWTEKEPNQDPEHTEEKLDEIGDWLEYCSLKSLKDISQKSPGFKVYGFRLHVHSISNKELQHLNVNIFWGGVQGMPA